MGDRAHAQNQQMNSWCKKFRLNQDVEPLINFAHRRMEMFPPMSYRDHQLLDRNSRYWDWPTQNLTEVPIRQLLDFIERTHKLPVQTEKTSLALWEYGEGDLLPPHIDLDLSLSATVVISLIGRFCTYLHDDGPEERIIDEITYGPGEYIVLNNTKVKHSGRPLDPYRLALVAFVDPRFDMTEFWRS